MDKPQIVVHAQHRPQHTLSDVKWVAAQPQLATVGQTAAGTGVLQVLRLCSGALSSLARCETPCALKCCSFDASTGSLLATGDYAGSLAIHDITASFSTVYSVSAHDQIINCIDGFSATGPPELVTGSRDGTAKVWDTRTPNAVLKIVPKKGESRDVWSVAFGDSYSDDERKVAVGYENGDIKLFDMKMNRLVWETNVRNGVCALQFDRKDIKMNKLIATTLESNIHAYDLRTFSPSHGFACTSVKEKENTTIWTVQHLPQNRELFMTSGGVGGLSLYKYNYPPKRTKELNGEIIGVAGSLELLQRVNIADQPVAAIDWCKDKLGLFACCSFDQCVTVGVVTKLEQF